eukprot:Skav211101  [mRNA]  locus=scaffold2002:484514:497979:+ [translate_table: standard]
MRCSPAEHHSAAASASLASKSSSALFRRVAASTALKGPTMPSKGALASKSLSSCSSSAGTATSSPSRKRTDTGPFFSALSGAVARRVAPS